MDLNKILSADILDIIFEGRNKEYGAYELRKTYKKRLFAAILGMVGACLLLFIGVALARVVKSDKPTQMLVQDVNLEAVKDEKKPEPPPPSAFLLVRAAVWPPGAFRHC